MTLLSRLKDKKAKNEEPGKVQIPQKKSPLDLGGVEINNSFGNYYLIEKEYSLANLTFPAVSKELLTRNLRLLQGIGPVTEREMREQGIDNINQLSGEVRWQYEVEIVSECILKGKIKELRRRGACDYELLSFFKKDDLVFLDIESTGLWANQPLFLVGILYKDGGKLKLQQYLARNLQEEKPLLADLYKKLRNFKVMVTYNGKKFDAPYIEGRWVEHRFFYRLKHYQIDLLYHARRHFKGKFPNCRLITLEEYLLNFKREGDIPGYLIPQTYYKFVKSGDPALIKDIIRHNALDLVSLARVLYIVQPCINAKDFIAATK